MMLFQSTYSPVCIAQEELPPCFHQPNLTSKKYQSSRMVGSTTADKLDFLSVCRSKGHYFIAVINDRCNTCSIIAVSLVSPAVVSPVAVVGVKQVDVLIIVTGQELCTHKRGQMAICLISL